MGLLRRLSIPRSALLVPFGEIDPLAANVNLADIRRPGFFAQAPYTEPIAAADGRAFTWEFTVPTELYERINKGITTRDKLRSRYSRGSGVRDRGRPVSSLVILIDADRSRRPPPREPKDPLYIHSAVTSLSSGT